MTTKIYCRECSTTNSFAEPPLFAECEACGSLHVTVTTISEQEIEAREDAIQQILVVLSSPLLRVCKTERELAFALAHKYSIMAAELLEYTVRRTQT